MTADEIRNLTAGHAERVSKMTSAEGLAAMSFANPVVIASLLGEIAAQLAELNSNLKSLRNLSVTNIPPYIPDGY